MAATLVTWAARVLWQQHWYFSHGYAFTLAFTLGGGGLPSADGGDGLAPRWKCPSAAPGAAGGGGSAGCPCRLGGGLVRFVLPLLDGSGVEADASALRGVGLGPVVLGVRLRALLAWTRAGAVCLARLCLSSGCRVVSLPVSWLAFLCACLSLGLLPFLQPFGWAALQVRGGLGVGPGGWSGWVLAGLVSLLGLCWLSC